MAALDRGDDRPGAAGDGARAARARGRRGGGARPRAGHPRARRAAGGRAREIRREFERERTELLAAASELAALAGSATTRHRPGGAGRARGAPGRRSAPRRGATIPGTRRSGSPTCPPPRRAGAPASAIPRSCWPRATGSPRRPGSCPSPRPRSPRRPSPRRWPSLVGDVERRYAGGEGPRRGARLRRPAPPGPRPAPRRPAVRAELRARVRALLVDEYQDVNGLQAEIFDLMAGAAGERRGGGTGGPRTAAGGRRRRQAVHLPVPRRRRRGLRLAHRAALGRRAGRWSTSARTTAPRPASSTS